MRRNSGRTALLAGTVLMVLICLPGCGTEAGFDGGRARTEADDASIRELVHLSVRALNAGDVDGFVALHTTDAVVLKPGSPPQVGLEEMRESITSLFERFAVAESRTIEELRVLGDAAVVWGNYESKLEDKESGEVSEGSGSYMEVLQRAENGRWKFARTIWN